MHRLLLITAYFVVPGLPAYANPAPEPGEVRPVIQAMREEIVAKPSRVLIAVEDALTMNEQAACEIVKEAISLTKADPKLVGEIVFTALEHAPAMSATIVECAAAASPDSVQQIELAMERAFGSNTEEAAGDLAEGSGKAAPDGKETQITGKEAAGQVSDAAPKPDAGQQDFDDSFLHGSTGVGGIYLVVPRSSFYPCLPGLPCCSGDLSTSCLKP